MIDGRSDASGGSLVGPDATPEREIPEFGTRGANAARRRGIEKRIGSDRRSRPTVCVFDFCIRPAWILWTSYL